MKEFFEDESHRDEGSEEFIKVFDEVNKIFSRQTDARLEVSYDNEPSAQYLVSGTLSDPTLSPTTFLAIICLISVLRAMLV